MNWNKIIKEAAVDASFVGGCASIGYGLYLYDEPLSWIFSGLVAVFVSYKITVRG